MTNMSSPQGVFAESSGGVATADTTVIAGSQVMVSVIEVTGSGTVAITAQTLSGDSYEVIYTPDDSTVAETITLGTAKSILMTGRFRGIKATSTDSPLPSFTLAVSKV